MELNGKAKEDFKNWCIKNNHDKVNIRYNRAKEIEKTFNIFQNALIIEWFDSVGIFINIIAYTKTKYRVIVRSNYDEDFNSRQEATEEAIKKANEIYNKE